MIHLLLYRLPGSLKLRLILKGAEFDVYPFQALFKVGPEFTFRQTAAKPAGIYGVSIRQTGKAVPGQKRELIYQLLYIVIAVLRQKSREGVLICLRDLDVIFVLSILVEIPL